MIPLRRLTNNRYPPDKRYSLIDVLKKEVFSYDLCEKDEELLNKQFDIKKILWILDGYDEIIQNVPSHLEELFEQLLKTPHHILTSRPYLNTLSYDVHMEITGFTDDNIKNYVKQFFDQMKDELDDASIKSEILLRFLESNLTIWGIAHIPVNLELICSLWSNQDGSETESLTITQLYSMITEWICRRYITSANKQFSNLSQEQVEQRCKKELTFLEILAFNAIENNTIIIRPSSLKKALSEAKVSLEENPRILNIGILKSFHKQGTGTSIEMNKDHYFVHLSFQEYFAARYLVNVLKQSSNKKAIEFIQYQKYNQRYALIFAFMSGLLNEIDKRSSLDVFWDNILGPPLDLVGIRHMRLVLFCLEETSDKSSLPRYTELLEWIAQFIKYKYSEDIGLPCMWLIHMLQRAQSVVSDKTIMDILIDLIQHHNRERQNGVLYLIANLNILHPSTALITSLTSFLHDETVPVTRQTFYALNQIATNPATIEMIISELMNALGDEREGLRLRARSTIERMSEKIATNEVITKFVSALTDKNEDVRSLACSTLGVMSEKTATNEVITNEVSALEDEIEDVRSSMCGTHEKMNEELMTTEVMTKLASALEYESQDVRGSACYALDEIGKKAAINEMSTRLVSVLGDESENVRKQACKALSNLAKKEATYEIIMNQLVRALEDENNTVRSSACHTLGTIGEKAATNEVVTKLVALANSNDWSSSYPAAEAISDICSSWFGIMQLDTKVISDLCLCKLVLKCFRNFSIEQLIEAFFATKNPDLMSVLCKVTQEREVALINIENKIVIYGSKEPFEFPSVDLTLRHQLTEACNNQAKRQHLYLELPSKTPQQKSQVFSPLSSCSIL